MNSKPKRLSPNLNNLIQVFHIAVSLQTEFLLLPTVGEVNLIYLSTSTCTFPRSEPQLHRSEPSLGFSWRECVTTIFELCRNSDQ